MSNNDIIDGNDMYEPLTNSFSIPNTWLGFVYDEDQRFYSVMSDVMLDDNKYDSFIRILTSLDKIKGNEELVNTLKVEFDVYRKSCKTEKENENKLFTDYEESPEYEAYQNFKIEPFECKVGYTTSEDNLDYSVNLDHIKKLYSSQNLNNNDKYNGKVKFN
jgi:hypothetical protein